MGNVFVGLGLLPPSCGMPSFLQPDESVATHCGRVQGGALAAVLGVLLALAWAAQTRQKEKRGAADLAAALVVFAVVTALGVWLGGAVARGSFHTHQSTRIGLERSGVDANTRALYFAQLDAAQRQADAVLAAGGSVAASLNARK